MVHFQLWKVLVTSKLGCLTYLVIPVPGDQCLVVMRETEAGCLSSLGVGTEMLYGGPHLDGRKQMMESGKKE